MNVQMVSYQATTLPSTLRFLRRITGMIKFAVRQQIH